MLLGLSVTLLVVLMCISNTAHSYSLREKENTVASDGTDDKKVITDYKDDHEHALMEYLLKKEEEQRGQTDQNRDPDDKQDYSRFRGLFGLKSKPKRPKPTKNYSISSG